MEGGSGGTLTVSMPSAMDRKPTVPGGRGNSRPRAAGCSVRAANGGWRSAGSAGLAARFTRTLSRFCVCLGVGFTSWAGPIFLQIEGVPGEATEPAHHGWIAVDGFSSGLRPGGGSAPARQPAATGIGAIGEVGFVKHTDKSSPKLAEALCQGVAFPKLTFEFVTVGELCARFYRVELEDVVVTAFRSAGEGEDRPTEELSLSFARATWVYTELAGSGKALADHRLQWDFLRNEGGTSTGRRGFTANAVVRPGRGLVLRWISAPGRRYQLFRSQDPAGPYVLAREIEASASGEERTEDLPTGRQLDFFLLREVD